ADGAGAGDGAQCGHDEIEVVSADAIRCNAQVGAERLNVSLIAAMHTSQRRESGHLRCEAEASQAGVGYIQRTGHYQMIEGAVDREISGNSAALQRRTRGQVHSES